MAAKLVSVGQTRMDEVLLILLHFLSKSLLEMCKGSVKNRSGSKNTTLETKLVK